MESHNQGPSSSSPSYGLHDFQAAAPWPHPLLQDPTSNPFLPPLPPPPAQAPGFYREIMMAPPPCYPFGGLQAEFNKMTAQEMMEAKALAASKSHSEAERRRRERINAHLAKLRSLLPSTNKTDKASLLAEVIQHLKELKEEASEIGRGSAVPAEADEITVDAAGDDEGRAVLRASLSCEDRLDLLPDLIRALKALKLRALKAEITTLGGRIKNILLVTGDGEAGRRQSLSEIQGALRAVVDRAAAGDETAAGVKRQRTSSILLERRSI